jgi:enoyl-CoA hydratase
MSAVELSIDGAVARLVLNRPERHNAMDVAMQEALEQATLELERRQAALRCVIFTGAGASFSSGADLKLFAKLGTAGMRQFMLQATWACRRLERLSIPVIAAVQGYCLGGGFEMALHSDLIVAAEDAEFGFPETGLGLVTTAGSAARLVAAVGTLRAGDLLLCARRVNAAAAERMGLVVEVTPPGALEETVTARAHRFASQPAAGVAAMKRLLHERRAAEQAASFLAELEAFEGLMMAHKESPRDE